MPLTERACRGLAWAGAVDGQPVCWDDAVPGFGVRLNAAGRLSFVVNYRVKGDPRQRFVTLGDYPATAAEAARRRPSARLRGGGPRRAAVGVA